MKQLLFSTKNLLFFLVFKLCLSNKVFIFIKAFKKSLPFLQRLQVEVFLIYKVFK